MQLGILGVGAIGQLLAQQLAAAGLEPWLLPRANTPSLAEQGEEQVYTLELGDQSLQTSFLCLAQDSSKLKQLDLLLVTVKAYQVEAALEPLLPKLHPDCRILLLHNGLGPHQSLAAKLNGRPLSLGTTSQGALKLSSNHIRQTGSGLTQIGDLIGAPMPEVMKTVLLNAIPGSQWSDTILEALWQKLAVNAVINPLTAIHRVNNGALAAPEFEGTICAILDELLQVAKQESIALTFDTLHTRVKEVIRLTAANYSSMYQDLKHGRKTEIDYINGYLQQRAEQYGLTLPINSELVAQIKALESNQL
ncbi:ketopantoate reductase family protein [Shewanella algae]|uniref:ketopantoate reductase family protein n=1 Tax=Shewanella algae TaxID=38313 RepID=UPI001AAEFAD7|nr:2-dehydropantoate 2-reductase [Shewanella algae]EKT4489564.1 2-dehydropantoate 2-reductase [Shewanella algae]MBO2548964.1 2-dehydropantoate 2-reductase [Shewanella algae]